MKNTSHKTSAVLAKQLALQAIFPFTLPWFPLFFVYNDLIHAFPEGSLLHNISEKFPVPFSLAASILLCLPLYRWQPDLLKIPATVSFPFLLVRGVVNTPLMYVAITIAVALISLLLDPPPWKSDNLQYIPLVFFTVFFYPPVLTPALAVVSIWSSALQKARKSHSTMPNPENGDNFHD